MKLYVDDDTVKGKLVALLRRAGHTLMLPIDLNMSGVSDARHFINAIHRGFVLLTRNHDDFLDLHEVVLAAHGTHPGLLIIRSDNDPTRDMTPGGIVHAITKLLASGAPVADTLQVLNHWR